jgi:N-acetylmuramoyl-L-alanine amidase
MKLIICFICSFLASTSTLFAQLAVADLQKKYTAIANNYLIKHKELEQYFEISSKGVATFSSEKNKKAGKAECFIFWDEIDEFSNLILHADVDTQLKIYLDKKDQPFTWTQKKVILTNYTPSKVLFPSKEKPLLGKKIAIDPGHIAGEMTLAKLESRFIEIKWKEKTYTFCEGDLTLTTAKLLQKKLENAGAEVILTRNLPNQTASGKLYKDWLKESLPKVLEKYVANKTITVEKKDNILKNIWDRDVYETYFLHEDFRDRMKKINDFNADISVVIHYNADAEKTQWNMPTKRNYSMTFVPGSFLKRELAEPIDRMAFLKLLLLGNLERSILLAKFIQQEFVETLQVPAIPAENALAYLNKASIYVDLGVYARNLGLCRLINSPIAYGESMYQDCETELTELHKNNENNKPAKRVEQVAEAYYKGILRYFAK